MVRDNNLNLRKVISDIIADTVKDVGSAPAGILYAGLMAIPGMTLDAFTSIMADLVKDGRVTRRGLVYYPGK